jgi:hypothetical protein
MPSGTVCRRSIPLRACCAPPGDGADAPPDAEELIMIDYFARLPSVYDAGF